ncbi:hypothetical protein [Nitratiruptor tergarcus]|uniref:Uncharacterized protein n=1 Tax=Nitratiruptor tergarcus DSM 16512 TaxID=1069081 RepID=A0A1W1WV85_9BACT|nr:hypothetical protein [Nitratiruptor tergarcus]SMC10187.1 hypothetical protein SAMN05660197_2029 [Nitratiruptor tergarcus DSM 16512]
MNRINPFYILLFLLIVFGITLLQNFKLKKELSIQNQKVEEMKKVAIKMNTLKNYWGDKKKQKSRVLALLKEPFVAKFLKDAHKNVDRYKVFLENVDAKSADLIFNKILNEFIKVNSIQIKRKNQKSINIQMEFKL